MIALFLKETMIQQGTLKDSGHLKPEDISRDVYFMDICRVVGEKGTCDRGRSWCVVVKDNQVLSTGYVDSPNGSPKCDEVGHQMWTVEDEHDDEKEHCMRNGCAELNAIANAARQGIELDGSTLYTKMTPCYVRHCAHLIVASGIKRVVCEKKYHAAERSEEIFKNAGIEVIYLENGVQTY